MFPNNYSDEQLLNKLHRLLASKHRLSAKIINACRTIPSAEFYIKRFGSLEKVYARVGYRFNKHIIARRRSQLQVAGLHDEVLRELEKLFPSNFEVVRYNKKRKTRPRVLQFWNGVRLSIVICLSEKTPVGGDRWKFQSLSARRHGFMSLLCFCNDPNTAIRLFYLMPSVIHIPMCSNLKEDDERLKSGWKLQNLRDLLPIFNVQKSA
jgi:hypothetical protein